MPKQPFRVRVEPVPKDKDDLRRLAHLIVKLAMEQTDFQRVSARQPNLLVSDSPTTPAVTVDVEDEAA